MRVSFEITCPKCGADPDPGPVELIADRISRMALACACGYVGVVTATLCPSSKGRLDHMQERLDVG